MRSVIEKVVQATQQRPELASFAGALVDRETVNVLSFLSVDARREAIDDLLPLLDPAAACQTLAVSLPGRGRFIGFRYEVKDAYQTADCLPDKDCLVGQARWDGNPVIEKTGPVTVVYGVFRNLSTDREREARLTVYFVPPPGWAPPSASP
jgi:hypothetical protein